jgi:hypothetical protein
VCVCVCDCASESDAKMLGATLSSKFHILLVPLVYFTTILILCNLVHLTYIFG